MSKQKLIASFFVRQKTEERSNSNSNSPLLNKNLKRKSDSKDTFRNSEIPNTRDKKRDTDEKRVNDDDDEDEPVAKKRKRAVIESDGDDDEDDDGKSDGGKENANDDDDDDTTKAPSSSSSLPPPSSSSPSSSTTTTITTTNNIRSKSGSNTPIKDGIPLRKTNPRKPMTSSSSSSSSDLKISANQDMALNPDNSDCKVLKEGGGGVRNNNNNNNNSDGGDDDGGVNYNNKIKNGGGVGGGKIGTDDGKVTGNFGEKVIIGDKDEADGVGGCVDVEMKNSHDVKDDDVVAKNNNCDDNVVAKNNNCDDDVVAKNNNCDDVVAKNNNYDDDAVTKNNNDDSKNSDNNDNNNEYASKNSQNNSIDNDKSIKNNSKNQTKEKKMTKESKTKESKTPSKPKTSRKTKQQTTAKNKAAPVTATPAPAATSTTTGSTNSVVETATVTTAKMKVKEAAATATTTTALPIHSFFAPRMQSRKNSNNNNNKVTTVEVGAKKGGSDDNNTGLCSHGNDAVTKNSNSNDNNSGDVITKNSFDNNNDDVNVDDVITKNSFNNNDDEIYKNSNENDNHDNDAKIIKDDDHDDDDDDDDEGEGDKNKKDKHRKKVIDDDDDDEEEDRMVNNNNNNVSNSKKTNSNKSSVANSNKSSVAISDKSSITISDKSSVTISNKKTIANSNVKSKNDLLYNPSKDKYHPIHDACWSKDERVPYIALARTFEEIEATSARLKSIEILSNFFRSVMTLTPEDLVPCVYLCLNRLAPQYEGVEMGVGENLLMKVVAQATGRSMDSIKSEIQEKGDLGLVAETSRSTQKTMFTSGKLTVVSIFNKLKEVSTMSGHSSMSKKVDKIKSMFVSCRGSEARYLIRSLGGKLRIGLAEQSVLQALGQAVVVMREDGKHIPAEVLKKKVDEATLAIKTAYCECPNYDLILPLLLKHPVQKLGEFCRLTPGIPLKPMLAHPTKGIQEVLMRFGGAEFVCEFKYDGERAQIHILPDESVRVYSRNQEDNTSKYPDIVKRLHSAYAPPPPPPPPPPSSLGGVQGEIEVGVEGVVVGGVRDAILDTEAVAWDSENGQILPFQVLSTRKRKDASSQEIKVQVCVYAFDLLYLNGVSLVREPLRKRREMLMGAFREVPGEFHFARSLVSGDVEEVSEFLDESIRGNCEGLMVKTLDDQATYEIAKRSRNWLKLKKDYLDGVGDTVDLVVMGGYHGAGKRVGRFGGFLLGCYDEEDEEFQTICKIGTGFSDADLEKHSEFFKGHTIDTPKPYYRFDSSHTPDKWFNVVQVWEVKAADLSLSPVHKAAMGLVDPEKGISLRFPRFIRVRDDKKAEEATSSSQIASMYKSQDQIVNQQKSKSGQEDEEEDAFY